MTKKPAGWDISKLDVDEYNKNARLSNFPPDKRWAKVEGALTQEVSSHPGGLISIGGIDHTGARVQFWTDVPNAMYLMNLLANVRSNLSSTPDVPSQPPAECKPYDGAA